MKKITKITIFISLVLAVSGCDKSSENAPGETIAVESADSIRGRFMRTVEYENGDKLITTLKLSEPTYEIKEYLFIFGELKTAHFRQYSGGLIFSEDSYKTELIYSTCEPEAETLFFYGNEYNAGETTEGLLRLVNQGIFLDFNRVERFETYLDLSREMNFIEDRDCDHL